MWCVLCHFDLPQDDVALDLHRGGRAICVRCYGRLTGTERPVPAVLARQVDEDAP